MADAQQNNLNRALFLDENDISANQSTGDVVVGRRALETLNWKNTQFRNTAGLRYGNFNGAGEYEYGAGNIEALLRSAFGNDDGNIVVVLPDSLVED